MKRIHCALSLFLVLVLLFALVPEIRVHASWEDVLTIYSGDSTAYVYECDLNASGSVGIPSSIKSINSAGEVTVYPVTAINEGAFLYCGKLTGIGIPSSVSYIGPSAFYGCTGLTGISIPDSVTSIGNDAFTGCTSLSSVKLSGSITSIEHNTFYGCTGLTSITIPEGVTSIGDKAFYGCTSLTDISIPDSVTSIGNFAFYGCTSLTDISIPDSVTSIGNSAFTGCTSLSEITIPDSVTDIKDYVFENCTGLRRAIIGNGVTGIPKSMFLNCTALTDVTISTSVTSIGGSAFKGCTSLTDLTIPASVTSMGYIVFENCTNLTNVYIGNGGGIGELAFSGCTRLNSVVIGPGSTSIAGKAFNGGAPVFITIPDSVTSFGYRASYIGASRLKHVFYTGTEEQWKAITDEGYNGYLYGATIHYNCTGDPAQYIQKSQAVLPTCTEPGYTVCTCTLCDTSYQTDTVAATGHSYEKGLCTACGAEDPDYAEQPVITLQYPSLTFEDVITMNVFFQAENLEDVVEMGLITYKSEVTEWNVDNAETVVPGYYVDESTGFYVVSTEGIAAKDMGDTYWFAVYAKLADGTYTYTKLVSYSPTTYAYNQLGDASMSKLVVAMLNYGAAAQTYFGYNTDNLMNAGLSADQQASIETYRADMMDAISTVTAEKSANFTKTATGFTKRYPTITFEGAFSIDYLCQPSATPVGDITLYYWNQADFDACDLLTTDNATGALTLVQDGDLYATAVEGIAAKDLDKGVYVAFCYSDGETDYCSGILGYSIGLYCTGLASGEDAMAPFAAATAVYGYYAKRTFN